jgi:uncharacterized protein (DUF2237 family)
MPVLVNLIKTPSMQKKFLLPVLFPMTIVFFLACSKSGPVPVPLTRSDMMASAMWKFSNAKVSGVDVSAALQDCQKDNLLRLYKNGLVNTGNIDEGLLKCNAADQQVRDIIWQMPDENTLVITPNYVLFAGGSNTFSIVSVNESSMVLSQVITVSGSSQTAVITFIH